MPLTLTELVSKIAAADSRDRDQVHTQIRNPAIRTHLVPLPGERGRTTAITYGEVEVARARIFLALMDIGYDARLIASVAEALRKPPVLWGPHPASARVGASFFYPSALETAVRGVAQGEKWDLRMRFARDSSGQRDVQVYVLWDGWAAEIDESDGALVDHFYGHTLLGEFRFPLTPLIGPLLSDAG